MSAETRRLLPILVPVVSAGLAALVAAAWTVAISSPSLAEIGGMTVLLVAAAFAEAFPVPIELDGLPAGEVSLAAVFIVGAAVLYGAPPAVLLAAGALGVIQVVERRELKRLAYNCAAYAMSGVAAGAAAGLVERGHAIAWPALAVALASAGFYSTNIGLVTAVVAREAGEDFADLLRQSVRSTAVPFSIMASVSLMLTVLWERSPLLSTALVGPLLALGLYQRSAYDALRAMRLALTDPLTGLGNHRHFHERLQRDLGLAEVRGTPLSLCLIDVDNLKQINDRYGHPVGDRALARVASRLRQGGEAFRLGGDEFALLLPGRGEEEALEVAEVVLQRIAATDCEHGGSVSVSAGIATYPQHGGQDGELVRVADSALYWAKEHGKGRVRIYRPDVVELAELRRLAHGEDRAARFLAAAALARAVDARDAYTGMHSSDVAELAARIAARMGLDAEQIELVRLAGSLHDVGKLAIPEEVLRKPGRLNAAERLVLERHPQIGFRMLDSLGIEPVATWVLHHHERWDGTGYPDRLAGAAIPLGARILFVADAYDAMTTDRVYNGTLSHDEAVREVEQAASSQFDPAVVVALKAEVGERQPNQLVAV